MAKEFTILYQSDALNKSEKAVAYCAYDLSDDQKKMIIEKAKRSFNNLDSNIAKYSLKQKMFLHLLDGLSKECVNELSKHLFHYVYAVCHKKGNSEEVIFMSAFKDKAAKYKNSIPSAIVKIADKEYNNPNYYVKELRLII